MSTITTFDTTAEQKAYDAKFAFSLVTADRAAVDRAAKQEVADANFVFALVIAELEADELEAAEANQEAPSIAVCCICTEPMPYKVECGDCSNIACITCYSKWQTSCPFCRVPGWKKRTL